MTSLNDSNLAPAMDADVAETPVAPEIRKGPDGKPFVPAVPKSRLRQGMTAPSCPQPSFDVFEADMLAGFAMLEAQERLGTSTGPPDDFSYSAAVQAANDMNAAATEGKISCPFASQKNSS
jgi:hypothetical protein